MTVEISQNIISIVTLERSGTEIKLKCIDHR